MLVFGVSSLRGGFLLSYRYFELGVGFGRPAMCGSFAPKIFAPQFDDGFRQKKRKRGFGNAPSPKMGFAVAKTYLLGMGTQKQRCASPCPNQVNEFQLCQIAFIT